MIRGLRRMVGLLVTFAMVFPYVGNAAASKSADLLLNVTYNDLETNAIPENVFGGSGTGVVVFGKDNKVLKLECDENGGEAAWEFNTSLEKEYIVEAEVKPTAILQKYKVSLKNASATLDVLNFDNVNNKMIDGKIDNGLRANMWNKISVYVNEKEGYFSLSINGNCITYRQLTTLSGFTALKITGEAKSESVVDMYIDNIRVYLGNEMLTDLPVAKFNPAVCTPGAEDNTENTEEQEEISVVYKETFDNYFDIEQMHGADLVLKEEENSIDLVKESNGNQYVAIKRGKKDPFIDIHLPSELYGKKYIWQFDVKASGARTSINLSDQIIIDFVGGEVRLQDGTVIGELNREGFTRIAIAIDAAELTGMVYIEGKPASKLLKCTRSADIKRLVRLYCYAASSFSELDVDNIVAYTGNTLVDIAKYGGLDVDVFATEEEAMAQGGDDYVAFHHLSSRAVINNERVEIGQKPQWKDQHYYIPQKIVELGFQAKVEEKDGKVYVNDTPVNGFSEEGIIYAEISDLATNVLKRNYYVDDTGFGFNKGFGIIGSKDFSEFENDFLLYADLNDYIVYSRPSPKQILNDVKKTSAGVHPRLFVTQDTFDRIKREIQVDPIKKNWMDDILATCDKYLDQPLPTLELTGPRWLAPNNTEAMIKNLCLAYKVTGETKYADKVWTFVEHMGKRANWHPEHFLDVGSACNLYAIAYDWLYDYWTDVQKKFLEETILKKGIYEYYGGLHTGKPSGWLRVSGMVSQGDGGNWPAVCASGGLMASLALMDVYPEICSITAADMFHMLEGSNLKGYADEGDWVEGVTYWAYNAGYLADLFAAAESAAGTDYDYFYNTPGIKETILYYFSLAGPTGVFNFGDARVNFVFDINSISWYANQWKERDPEYSAELFKLLNKYHKLNNRLGRMWSIFYMDNKDSQGEPNKLKNEYYSDKLGLGVFRTSWEFGPETYLGYVRGGKVTLSHDHWDHGSFVFDCMGTRWASDLGWDDYNIPNYGTDAYRVRTEAHNTYVINPDLEPGQLRNQYGNYNVRKEYNKNSYLSVEDLTSSYKTWVNSARRGYKITDKGYSLEVRDEIEFKDESQFYWFLTTKTDVVSIEGNTAILSDGTKMKFEFVSNQPLALSVMACDPLPTSPIPKATAVTNGNTPNPDYRKLALVGTVSGKLTVHMKLSPIVDGVETTPLDDVSFDTWSLDPETEVKERPTLSAIIADGEPIAGFMGNKTAYTYRAIHSDAGVEISASAGENVDFTIEKGYDNIYTIICREKTDPSNFMIYKVKVLEYNSPNVNGQYKLITPASITASAAPQSANPISAAMDGDLATRWAAEGEQWIMQSFDKEYEISALDLAWFNGSQRNLFYKVQYSTDGVNFTTLVDDTKSTGKTDDLELTEFAPVKAKYIRILCNGSTEGSWTGLTEFYVYRKG